MFREFLPEWFQATLPAFRPDSKPQPCVHALSTATPEVPALNFLCPSGMHHATWHRTDCERLASEKLTTPLLEMFSHFRAGHDVSPISLTLFSFFGKFYLFIWPHWAACGILVSQPGIEPEPPALEAWSLNHWTHWRSPSLCPHQLLPLYWFTLLSSVYPWRCKLRKETLYLQMWPFSAPVISLLWTCIF